MIQDPKFNAGISRRQRNFKVNILHVENYILKVCFLKYSQNYKQLLGSIPILQIFSYKECRRYEHHFQPGAEKGAIWVLLILLSNLHHTGGTDAHS